MFIPKPEGGGDPGSGGVDDGTKSLLSDVIATLRDVATLLGAPPTADAVQALSQSIENKTVTQNVEITNQFHGDRAGQEKSAEAMDKAADDATGQLARGLAYAR